MPARTVHQPASDGSAGGGALHLTVMAPGTYESHPLPPTGVIRIGRDEAAEVRITDELASRLHARLHLASSTEIFVEDLESSNGTFVRGQRIEPGQRVPLLPGEAITIGYTHLTVQRRRPRTAPRRLHGHGAFEERLEDACARLTDSGGVLSVARIKLDDEGSSERAAELVAAGLRPGDFLAQYGPADYEILLLDTEPGRAEEIAAAVVERAKAEGRTARAAVVAAPTDGRSAEALIGRATTRLRGFGNETRDPVFKSEAMRALYRIAERAANGRAAAGLINVLILGETGTGKEVLAEWLHRHSPRAAGPFICINCAALTDSLLESELFGHEKGAFTGAAQAKAGLLEAAAGGTVFLDEIGEMPAVLQTKLLRALESRQVTRVGAVAPRAIDARFLAATNRDLEAEIIAKTFRQDQPDPAAAPGARRRDRAAGAPLPGAGFRRLPATDAPALRRGAGDTPGLRLARQHP
jgi:two-component system response regulator AtoC